MYRYTLLAAVVLAAAAFFLLPVGLDIRCSGRRFSVTGRVGPASVRLLPRERKARTGKKPLRERIERLRRTPPELVRAAAEEGALAAGRLLRYGAVRRLCLRYTAGGPDVCAAAMAYARAGLAMEGLSRWAEGRCARTELRADVDFDAPAPRAEGRLVLASCLGRLMYIGLCFGMGLLRGYFHCRKNTQREG